MLYVAPAHVWERGSVTIEKHMFTKATDIKTY